MLGEVSCILVKTNSAKKVLSELQLTQNDNIANKHISMEIISFCRASDGKEH